MFTSNLRRVTADSEGTSIRKSLAKRGHTKWGWVIYRCTYDDDAVWQNFLHVLNTNTRQSLEESGDEDMWQNLEWIIIEDKEGLDGASTREVRRRFREWVAQRGVTRLLGARTSYCISVDAAALTSIATGPQPPERDFGCKTWVNLIDYQWEEPSEEDADEGEPPIDGSRLEDVGWMKTCAGSLAPRAYNVLDDSGAWIGCYRRPPMVVRI